MPDTLTDLAPAAPSGGALVVYTPRCDGCIFLCKENQCLRAQAELEQHQEDVREQGLAALILRLIRNLLYPITRSLRWVVYAE